MYEYPSYNSEEDKKVTKELFLEYDKTKDLQLRDTLIERNLYIVEILSKKHANRGIEYDDIFQVASIGLIHAVDRFDVHKGFAFSSFATPTIIGEIKRHFRDKGWTIRVPRRIQELSLKVNNAKVELSQKLQYAPTVQDIAEYLKITEEEVLEAMEGSNMYTLQSLDFSINSEEDKELTLKDLVGEEDFDYIEVERADFFDRALENLNEVEKKVLLDRYFHDKTQAEVAKELDISQMTVSRMERRIIKKLRKEVESTEMW